MLYRYTENILAEAVLFEDHHQTNFNIVGVSLHRDKSATDNSNDVGGYYHDRSGTAVASGRFMLNYNIPYADIYMDVKEKFRRNGFGTLIVEELKKGNLSHWKSTRGQV